ncbi:MAG: hypothetical protein IH852_15895 [Bacteroidetes bacterium]|nr:hypothetical protein [Bacteroidota bacterium]
MNGILFFGFLSLILLIGIVSAWSVSITELNNNPPTSDYSLGVNSFSYLVNNLTCSSDYSWTKYSLNGNSNQSTNKTKGVN